MTPAEMTVVVGLIKLGTDIGMDMYIEAQKQGYTPDQLLAMISDEETRKNAQNAAWAQMKVDAGL